MTDDNLASVFDDSNDAAEIETVETKESEGEKEPEKEAEVKAEVQDAEPPAAENKEEVWSKKAVLDERKKRQALEAELAELKKIKPSEEQNDEPTQVSIEDRLWQERVIISQQMALDKYEDYEEMESIFVDMAKENPALGVEIRKVPNPAKFAYTTAKQYEETKKLSDPDSLAKMKEEIRKEVLAELEAKQTPGDKRRKAALSVTNISNSTHTDTNSSKARLSSLEELFD